MPKLLRRDQFGPSEAIALISMAALTKIFLSYPRSLVEIGGPACWLTPLGGLAAALCGIYILSVILKKRPNKNIIEIYEETFGPYLGAVVNIIFVVLLLEAVGAIFLRQFCESMTLATLPLAPITLIEGTLLSVGLLGAYLGIEALARTARLTFFFIIGGTLALVFCLIPFWNPHNLLPIMGNGPKEVFLMGTVSTAGVIEIVLAGIIVQAMGGSVYFSKVGYSSILLSFGLLFLILLTLILTYETAIAEEFSLPFLRLARTIYFGGFFQRLEAIFIFLYTIVAALKISLLLYGAAVSLAKSLKLPFHRPLIWPLGLLMYILSQLPPDMSTVANLDENILLWLTLISCYLIPVLVLAIIWFKRRLPGAHG